MAKRIKPWGYCFYCDAARVVGPCQTCGHRVWFAPTQEPQT